MIRRIPLATTTIILLASSSAHAVAPFGTPQAGDDNRPGGSSAAPQTEISDERASRTARVLAYGGWSGGASGAQSGEGFYGIRIRPGFHDLLDWEEGFLSDSEIRYLEVDLRGTVDPWSFRLQQLDLFSFVFLPPVDSDAAPVSWSARAGAQQPWGVTCDSGAGFLSCLGFLVQVGAGYSVVLSPSSERLLLYGLVRGNVEAGGVLDRSWRLGPSITGGLLAIPLPNTKISLSFETFAFPMESPGTRVFHRIGASLSWQALSLQAVRLASHLDVSAPTGLKGQAEAGLAWFF